jgi:hypothetical protein
MRYFYLVDLGLLSCVVLQVAANVSEELEVHFTLKMVAMRSSETLTTYKTRRPCSAATPS